MRWWLSTTPAAAVPVAAVEFEPRVARRSAADPARSARVRDVVSAPRRGPILSRGPAAQPPPVPIQSEPAPPEAEESAPELASDSSEIPSTSSEPSEAVQASEASSETSHDSNPESASEG